MSRLMRLHERWTERGDRHISRDLVEADWPGYYDWADRRGDLRMPHDRAPPIPAEIAADVGRGDPAALTRLSLEPEEHLAGHDVALPQHAVE
eukprot:10045952-Alexandrium_andersonii.AAC.1